MSLIGYDNSEVIKFVSSLDNGEPKTVFHIGRMKLRDKIKLFDELNKDAGSVSTDKTLDLVLSAVKKIENVNINGELKTIEDVKEDNLQWLTIPIMSELSQKIVEVNFLSDQEQKN